MDEKEIVSDFQKKHGHYNDLYPEESAALVRYARHIGFNEGCKSYRKEFDAAFEKIKETNKLLDMIKQKRVELVKKWVEKSQSSAYTDAERAVYEMCARDLFELGSI